MDKISPCLWFDAKAEEAARFYTSLFPNSRINSIDRSPGETPSGPKDMVLTVNFTLDGHTYIALNGGPDFTFNEAISLSIDCEDQAEVDRYWNALLEGGKPEACGWLKDRYGVSWQIVPTVMFKMMADPDRAKAKRATDAMLTMVKFDIATLKAAFEGKQSG